MPIFERGDVHIHYEVEGEGPPVLLLAPGGMRSANELWGRMPWNPRTALVDHFQLIGMDQRNAGASTAPVSGADGWSAYADDQLALLDHLGVDRCHVLGMCIGGPFIFGLLTRARERFHSAVLLQPVGIDSNRQAFHDLFDDWAAEIQPLHPEATADDWESFASNMWDGEFVLTATPNEVSACVTPMLVLMGNDLHHPEETSRQVAELAPNATLIERWKDADYLTTADAAIKAFLSD